MEKNEAIIVDPKKFGLDEVTASKMTKGLEQIIKERDAMIPQYDAIIKMDIDDPVTVQMAYDHLQLIKKNRTKGIKPWFTTVKEYYLRGGQFCDAINRKETRINEYMEENLEAIVKNGEIKEAKRKAELKTARLELLAAYPECNTEFFNLEEMDGATFGNLLKQLAKDKADKDLADKKKQEEDDAKQRKAELEEQRTAETIKLSEFIPNYDTIFLSDLEEKDYQKLLADAQAAKVEKDKKDAATAAENLRLKQENEKKDAELKAIQDKADKEKKDAEAKLEAERKKAADEKEVLEKQLADKKAAEDKIAADKIAAEKAEAETKRKAALAPVKDQLKAWVKAVVVPGIDQTKFNDPAKKVSLEIMAKHEAWKAWAEVEINKLN